MYQVEEISLELTNSCQLACVHCSSGSAPPKLAGELPFAKHLELLKEARTLGATAVSYSGGNPLNYQPDDRPINALPELITDANLLGYERQLLYTTGHNDWGSTIRYFEGVDVLLTVHTLTWIFSIHSHLSATHDMIMRRPGALEEIKDSIQWLKDEGQTVEIHMVPMKPNYLDIPKVRDMCEDLGVSKMSCLRFVPQTRGKTNERVLGMTVANFVEMQFVLHQEFFREHPVEIRLGCPIDFRHAIGLLPEKRKPCHAGDDLILVRPTGDVHPCAAWKSLPADSNVNRANLTDIWMNSPVFQAIRNFKVWAASGTSDGYKLTGVCGLCSMVKSCMGGCPAQRLHAMGSRDIADLYVPHSDPLCPRGDGDDS